MRERESLRTLCDRLRRERDRAVSDLAEALSESEDIKKQKNLASKQLKELRERIETEKENRSMRFQYLSNSSSFSESRDSAIDSDMPSGHYSIKVSFVSDYSSPIYGTIRSFPRLTVIITVSNISCRM